MMLKVTLHTESDTIEIKEQYQVDAMAEAVKLLIEEYDLLDEVSFPVEMKNRAILNSKPEHADGTEMNGYKQVSDSCYLFVNVPARTKMTQLEKFADICDVDIYFTGWPELSRQQ